MDDIADSVESTEEAQIITNNICDLLKPGHFYIKEWTISGQCRSMVNLCNQGTQKVLGIIMEPYVRHDSIRCKS